MLYRVCVLDIPFVVLICSRNVREQGIVFDKPCCYLYRILLSSVTERVYVIASSRDADHQLIGIC